MRVIKRKGHIRRTVTGQHVWIRPNERVKLRGFNRQQVNYLRPTFKALDQNTQKHVKFRSNVVLTGEQKVLREYRRHYGGKRNIAVGGLAYPSKLGHGKNKILLNEATFKRKGYYHPGGVLTHEFAHAAQFEQGRKAEKAWDNARRQSKPARRTRQNIDAHEDFAESFRHALGQPITHRNSKQFRVAVDQSRQEHLYKHYLKQR